MRKHLLGKRLRREHRSRHPGGSGLRGIALAAALVGLTGCSTTRYVTIPCLDAEQYQKLEQAEPEKVGDRLTGNAQNDVKVIAGSAVKLRTYSRDLLGVLRECTGDDRP